MIEKGDGRDTDTARRLEVTLHDEMLAMAPKLQAYAFALTRGGWSDAEDLVQDTLMRAWQFRHTFEPGTNLKAWLFRILRNAFLASQVRLRTVSDSDDVFSRRLAHEPDQEWHVQFSELLEALASLPERSREALLLVVGSGLTYEQAAQVCDCSVGTVKSRISRARDRLIELMDDRPAPQQPANRTALRPARVAKPVAQEPARTSRPTRVASAAR